MADNKKNNFSYSSLTGIHRAMPIILIAIAVFSALCFITKDIGAMGRAISNLFLGLFSYGAYAIPFLIALHGLFYPSDFAKKRRLSRAIFSTVTIIFVSALIYTVSNWGEELTFDIGSYYKDGKNTVGGGFIGSIIGFALIKIFGSVGLTVIAVAVLAIYVSYFFSGGENSLKKFALGILRAIVSIAAFFERGIKKIFSGAKKRKSEKNLKISREKNRELYDDEFFGVDNGIEKLEISELGIMETRNKQDIEENPTLHEKVFHKSSSKEHEPTLKKETPKTFFEVDFDQFDNVENSAEDIVSSKENPHSSATGFTAKESNAADVFTNDFDPYDIAVAERLAKKPSSKSAEFGNVSVSENLYEITPEDVERARRNANFERRKKIIVGSRRQEATLVNNSGEFEGNKKHIEFNEQATSTNMFADEKEETFNVRIDKNEDSTANKYADMGFGDGYDFTEGDTVFSCHKDSELNPSSVDNDLTRDSGNEQDKDSTFVPNDENVIFGKEKNDADYNSDTAFSFDFSTADDEIKEERETITVERSMFNEDFSEDEEEYCDDEEYSEIEEHEDDEQFCDEIQEEEQNPIINEYRGMFSVFKDEEKKTDDKNLFTYAEQEQAAVFTDEDVRSPELEDDSAPPFEIQASNEPPSSQKATSQAEQMPKKASPDYSKYIIPPLELLGIEESANDEEVQSEINENTRILIETLQSFNVTASIKGVDRGPRITRYEVVPAKGVKVNQITHLFDDIALNLAAEGIRMEAPIPGKSAIGFEIPNKHPETVRLRELLECEEFINAKSKTFVCIGKDVAGSPVFGDIAKFPHALVAGATGMGKSVCINSLMISMLYKAKPNEVKFIMIDPKKVEFKMYSGIPHLLIPVITEAKQAAGALMWAVEEMERRYEFIEQHNIRNIESYNEKVALDPSLGEPIPKIVIVIDELNDLMMQVRDPVEDLIMRIAQKARAAGIHLIIGTQRPDVKVITGTIKANINTRLSCKVTSVQDSRTILEMAGAEKLLNKGDMLFKPVDKTKPVRVQSAFVSDSEVENIMNFIKSESSGAQYDEDIFAEINRAAQKCQNNKKSSGGFGDTETDDEQFGYYNDQQFLDAVELAIRSGKISTSLLQRKLSMGYSRAAKYIDAMEEIGVVSEPNGQKPRDTLITLDEWYEKLSRVSLD